MRILKYLFLLLLLLLVGVAVFVATQKDSYSVTRTQYIKMPRAVVFAYVGDFKNWTQFANFNSDANNTYKFPAVTSGKNAYFEWTNSSSTGTISNRFVKSNDSIAQTLKYNEAESEMHWKFKDTLGGTLVTWKAKGRMDFRFKVAAITSGGVDKLMGAILEQNLNTLDRHLVEEMNSKSVAFTGVVNLPAVGYIKQSITSTLPNLPGNIRIMLAKMHYFFKKNGLKASGKPFIVYETYDTKKGICRFSVCMPIPEEIYISETSDMRYGKMPALRALKVTLKGDISHIEMARKLARTEMNNRNWESLPKYPWIEQIEVGAETTNRPSQWITHLLIPVGAAQITPALAVDSLKSETPKLPVSQNASPN